MAKEERRAKVDRLLALLRAGVEWNEAVRKVKEETPEEAKKSE